MTLENWDWFIKLVELGSFTRAAQSVELSQQALSARLAALEKGIGAKLVQRTTPLRPTPAGQAFLLYAREQRQAQQDLVREIGEVSGGGAGLLKVGIAQMRGRSVMPQVIERVVGELPNVCFELVEKTNNELIGKAERGEIDLAVALFGDSHPGIDVEPLTTEHVVLAVSKELLERVCQTDAETAVARIGREGLGVLRECPFGLGKIEDISGRIAYSELRNAGIRPRSVLTSEHTSTLLAACARGIAAVFSPDNLIESAVADASRLVRIPLSAQASYTIGMGTPMQAPAWRAVELLKEALREAYSRDS